MAMRIWCDFNSEGSITARRRSRRSASTSSVSESADRGVNLKSPCLECEQRRSPAALQSGLAPFPRQLLVGPRDVARRLVRFGAGLHREPANTGIEIPRRPSEFVCRPPLAKKLSIPAVGILANPCRRVAQVILLERHRTRAAERTRLGVTSTRPCRTTSVVQTFLGCHSFR